MTSSAPIEIEPRPQTRVISRNCLLLVELSQSGLKERQIVGIGGDRSERLARVHSRVAAYSRICLCECHSSKEQHGQGNNRGKSNFLNQDSSLACVLGPFLPK